MKSLINTARRILISESEKLFANVAAADMKNLKSNTGELLISESENLFQNVAAADMKSLILTQDNS